MLHSLIAYDASGEIIGTLDHMVAKDDDGNVIGLIDFEAHEKSGGKLRDVWEVSNAVGSGTWPEWLGGRAHDFKVELDGGRIARLRHRQSGHVRDRADIEQRIAARIAAANGEPADIRDIVGGPGKPLLVDDEGKTRARLAPQRKNLPIIGRATAAAPAGAAGPAMPTTAPTPPAADAAPQSGSSRASGR